MYIAATWTAFLADIFTCPYDKRRGNAGDLRTSRWKPRSTLCTCLEVLTWQAIGNPGQQRWAQSFESIRSTKTIQQVAEACGRS